MTDNRGAGFVDRGIQIADGIVRRPRGYWSDTVLDLLRSLADSGFGLSPTPIGLDEQFEYLQFIDGTDQGWPLLPVIQRLEGSRLAGTCARSLESSLGSYRPVGEANWQSSGPAQLGGPVAHGDLGPWNLLWDNERGAICGVIDWDLAGPAPKGYDAGFLAWFMVPMMSDDRARERGFELPIVRGGRLLAFCDGYGMAVEEMLDCIISSQEEFQRRILSASHNHPPMYAMLKQLGIADQIGGDIQFTRKWRRFMQL